SVVNSETARLVFDHRNLFSSGLLLDNVKLTRVDSAAVLLEDHFDLTVPSGTFPLQIVPVLTGMDVVSVAADGLSAVVRLDGAGFIEGENTTYQFGSATM